MNRLTIEYSTLKQIVDATSTVYWYQNADGSYVAYLGNDTFFIKCNITGDDVADFEAQTWKVSQNEVGSEDDAAVLGYYIAGAQPKFTPRAKDGRLTIRQTTANRTTTFKLRAFSFETATGQSGVHNINPITDTDYGDVTVTMYDVNGDVTTDPATSVKLFIDWEPHYNYEIIGGYMDIPSDLLNGTSNAWFISAVGVPDVPAQYGGSIDYISEVNLEAVTAQRIISDGRAISYLPYLLNGAHTNKLRFIVKHPVNLAKRFQVYIEHFTT